MITVMKTVAGVFRFYQAARAAAGTLRRAGFSQDQVNLLSPASSAEEVHSVPTSDTEQPGIGGAIGGMVGGAVGLAGGFELGIAVTALIPGIGPIIAIGIAGAALLGVGGAVGGALLGEAADEKSTEGVPADEVFFYENALRQGKSVVLVLVPNDSEETRARKIMEDGGAQSLDAAKDDWWVGLRDAQAERYQASGHNFEADQEVYRAGFESALRRECRGKSIDERSDCLKWWHPEVWDTEAFRHGYEAGREFLQRYSAEEALSARPR